MDIYMVFKVLRRQMLKKQKDIRHTKGDHNAHNEKIVEIFLIAVIV